MTKTQEANPTKAVKKIYKPNDKVSEAMNKLPSVEGKKTIRWTMIKTLALSLMLAFLICFPLINNSEAGYAIQSLGVTGTIIAIFVDISHDS